MTINSKYLGLAGTVCALGWLLQIAACTSDSGSDAAGAGGSATSSAGASGTAGSAGSSGSSAGSSGSAGASGSSNLACANPIMIPSTKPKIADFESYDGSDFKAWSFAFGGDPSLGLFAGTFAYGDRPDGFPEIQEVSSPGANGTMFAQRIADTDPARMSPSLYGGGMGLWLSSCLDATAFTGITFWVRGSSPKPTPSATLSIAMKETMTSSPTKATDKAGTCSGTSTTCINPKFDFPVTDTWTQIKAPWSGFTAGDAAGTTITPDGRNINQVQFDIGLNFVPGDGGAYVAVPAAYELVVDEMAFY